MADDVSTPVTAAAEPTPAPPESESRVEKPTPPALPEPVSEKTNPEPPAGEEKTKEEPPPAKTEPEPPAKHHRKKWYVVKVQSGREDTIKEAIERRVRKEGLEEFFGQIVIPVEKVTEVKTDKNGKRVTRTKERKLYPGYLMCEVEYNERILYLFRETSGVGDFVGAQPAKSLQDELPEPTPMSAREIQRMMGPLHEEQGEAPALPKPPPLSPGDRVRVVDGTFNGMEGTVKQILDAVAKVQVEVTIFGRPVAVDLEYYQVEQA
jgi:transcriptional antiterminator NusG